MITILLLLLVVVISRLLMLVLVVLIGRLRLVGKVVLAAGRGRHEVVDMGVGWELRGGREGALELGRGTTDKVRGGH